MRINDAQKMHEKTFLFLFFVSFRFIVVTFYCEPFRLMHDPFRIIMGTNKPKKKKRIRREKPTYQQAIKDL